MIAYNKTLLENTFLVEEAIDLRKSGFIQNENLNSIKQQLTTLKTSRNIFVRAGFFLLGVLLYLSIIGLLFLIIMNSSSDFETIGFVVSIIGVAILELLCNQNFFRHGLDDAFIIGAQLSFYSTIVADSDSPMGAFISMIIIGLAFAIRYVNTLSFLIFLSGIVFLVSFLLIENTEISAILPFVLVTIAIGFYYIHQKFKDHQKLYLYEDLSEWFFIYTLFLGYVSVNYFVVRTLSEELLSADYSKTDMPFGWMFYILMFVVPLAYILYSLKTKNRTMLYIGGLTFALSIATFRYYHSVLPAEWALILSGLGIFAFVYFVIQKIKTNETGITFQHDRTNDTAMLNNIEAIIVNSQDIKHAEETQQSTMPFGGGGFSGGGAGGSF
ncbi:hypothetical protein [Flavobacterium soli]|uniref:hypothetical protein n=1 Tax=Flavobacterium soli TaxID=344881 RepID=UPI000422FE6B|nr:hypothetical protein [Flavobacterium soli]